MTLSGKAFSPRSPPNSTPTALDAEWTAKNINAQIEAGVDGIITAPAPLGEASTLSRRGKARGAQIALKAAANAVPVLRPWPKTARATPVRGQTRGRIGAAGLMVLPGLR